MQRLSGLIGVLAVTIVVAGCDLGLPGAVEPPCQSHPDPSDCQGALDVALGELIFDPATHALSVAPIWCSGGTCTTWVSSLPTSADDCLPSHEAELTRSAFRPWTVAMLAHGDPICAFEP